VVRRLSRAQKLGLGGGAVVLACLVLVAVLAGGGGGGRGGGPQPPKPAPGRPPDEKTSDHAAQARGYAPSTGSKHNPGSPPSANRSARGLGEEEAPVWSVWVVAALGGRPRVVARTPSEVPVTPAWSDRDGLLAFVRPTCEECDAALWTTRADGSDARRFATGLGGNLTDPTWAPSRRALAIVHVGGGLYAVSARDGASRPLLPGSVVEDPSWAPGGGAIVFARRQGAAGWDLYAIRPNAGGLRRLTRSRAQELAPDWSPDGRKIAFQRQERSGAWSVYEMRADGSGARRLVAGTSADNAEQPAWSPDGRSIAFVAVTLSGSRIEVLRLGGGRAPRRLTGPSLEAADPDWSPDGRRIVFSGKRPQG
jgi:TolB protein